MLKLQKPSFIREQKRNADRGCSYECCPSKNWNQGKANAASKLVYAAAKSSRIDRKTRIARGLLLQGNLCIFVQVLNEFTVNARHGQKLNLTAKEEYEWVQRWLLFPIREMTVACYLNARFFHERYQVSHWDGLILAAAREANCEILYSEELQPKQTYDSITVINPFTG